MLKESMIAAAAAVSALVALLAMPESSKTEPALPDNGERDAYSVSDYYGGEYDWPRLKLAEPSTKQSITRDVVPQVESLTPDQLARLAKQEDFCSGPFSIRCFGIPTSKLRGYVEWAWAGTSIPWRSSPHWQRNAPPLPNARQIRPRRAQAISQAAPSCGPA